jgi:hypothetical protein
MEEQFVAADLNSREDANVNQLGKIFRSRLSLGDAGSHKNRNPAVGLLEDHID